VLDVASVGVIYRQQNNSQNADQSLCSRVLNDEYHVLHRLMPDNMTLYSLQTRSHNRELKITSLLMNCNLVVLMLHCMFIAVYIAPNVFSWLHILSAELLRHLIEWSIDVQGFCWCCRRKMMREDKCSSFDQVIFSSFHELIQSRGVRLSVRRLSVNFLRKSLLLRRKRLNCDQTCTRWSPGEHASRVCSRSRSLTGLYDCTKIASSSTLMAASWPNSVFA